MPATLRDVARKAGVSVKTASRVVNKQAEVSEETRQRVLAAIAELSYQPGKLVRALVTQHTDTVGLILGDINNFFFPEFARGVGCRRGQRVRCRIFHLFIRTLSWSCANPLED